VDVGGPEVSRSRFIYIDFTDVGHFWLLTYELREDGMRTEDILRECIGKASKCALLWPGQNRISIKDMNKDIRLIAL